MTAANGYRTRLVGGSYRCIEVGDQVLIKRDIEIDIPGKILCLHDRRIDIEFKALVDIISRNIDLGNRAAEYQAAHLGKDHVLDFLVVVVGGKCNPAIEKGCIESDVGLRSGFP